MVEDLIRDALTIAERLDPPEALQAPAFAAAVQLLAQTVQAPAASVPLALPDVRLTRPH